MTYKIADTHSDPILISFPDPLFLITQAPLLTFSQAHFIFRTIPPESLKNKKSLSLSPCTANNVLILLVFSTHLKLASFAGWASPKVKIVVIKGISIYKRIFQKKRNNFF